MFFSPPLQAEDENWGSPLTQKEAEELKMLLKVVKGGVPEHPNVGQLIVKLDGLIKQNGLSSGPFPDLLMAARQVAINAYNARINTRNCAHIAARVIDQCEAIATMPSDFFETLPIDCLQVHVCFLLQKFLWIFFFFLRRRQASVNLAKEAAEFMTLFSSEGFLTRLPYAPVDVAQLQHFDDNFVRLGNEMLLVTKVRFSSFSGILTLPVANCSSRLCVSWLTTSSASTS